MTPTDVYKAFSDGNIDFSTISQWNIVEKFQTTDDTPIYIGYRQFSETGGHINDTSMGCTARAVLKSSDGQKVSWLESRIVMVCESEVMTFQGDDYDFQVGHADLDGCRIYCEEDAANLRVKFFAKGVDGQTIDWAVGRGEMLVTAY